jgi:hypothetical protein
MKSYQDHLFTSNGKTYSADFNLYDDADIYIIRIAVENEEDECFDTLIEEELIDNIDEQLKRRLIESIQEEYDAVVEAHEMDLQIRKTFGR